jgi:hypothetical protein
MALGAYARTAVSRPRITITQIQKSEFLRALGAKRLPEVSLRVAQIIVGYLNPTLGVAFASYDRYAKESGMAIRLASWLRISALGGDSEVGS